MCVIVMRTLLPSDTLGLCGEFNKIKSNSNSIITLKMDSLDVPIFVHPGAVLATGPGGVAGEDARVGVELGS